MIVAAIAALAVAAIAGMTALKRSSPSPAEADPKSTGTKIVSVSAVDEVGAPLAGFTVEVDGIYHVEDCTASPVGGKDIVACYPTAAGADVCWVGADRVSLICGTHPWETKARRMPTAAPIGEMNSVATPLPWGVELANGARCRIRNGGSWGQRADGLVGAYSCDKPGNESYILARPENAVIDKTAERWKVLVGFLGADGDSLPPPEHVAVVTAYFAVSP